MFGLVLLWSFLGLRKNGTQITGPVTKDQLQRMLSSQGWIHKFANSILLQTIPRVRNTDLHGLPNNGGEPRGEIQVPRHSSHKRIDFRVRVCKQEKNLITPNEFNLPRIITTSLFLSQMIYQDSRLNQQLFNTRRLLVTVLHIFFAISHL